MNYFPSNGIVKRFAQKGFPAGSAVWVTKGKQHFQGVVTDTDGDLRLIRYQRRDPGTGRMQLQVIDKPVSELQAVPDGAIATWIPEFLSKWKHG